MYSIPFYFNWNMKAVMHIKATKKAVLTDIDRFILQCFPTITQGIKKAGDPIPDPPLLLKNKL
ncbi:MAG: hypothetical protein OEZ41_06235 [Nitrospirota bacterium]|nr:hypothetical protein [Nitrospirota bacterium]